MKSTVLEAVPRTLRKKLDRTKKYVAAVSGGADSLALAEGLWQAGFDFVVCHVEHGIRGQESLEDARFVEAFCQSRNIPFCCKTVRAPEYRVQEKLSLEDAARQLRYEALAQCADEVGADFILTAHQKDDQAETFLLRLLRGSGTRGLGSIPFRRERIMRPLLSLTGQELREYCRTRHIEWREDRTNQDLHYARNRVRKLVIPLLEENFSPAVTDILCRTAAHLQTDSLFLEQLAAEELQQRLRVPAASQKGVLLAADWDQIPAALRFRVLRQFWQKAGGRQELSGLNLEDMEQLIGKKSSGKKILLPDSWQALYSYDKLILFSSDNMQAVQQNDWQCMIRWDEIPRAASAAGEEGLECRFPDGRKARLCIVQGMPAYTYRRQMVYPLDRLQRLGGFLSFRHRNPGDRIFPLKGTGHKTLKKYLMECRIPVEHRDELVVAAVGSEIVWLPGLANARWPEADEQDCRFRDWLFINLLS
ncbi:MAG: tRNA lysidine(34) synthetase TilS [Acidaminococcaceae bacterium]|nr:tRNA lysidine(34) synthetase TilS [Acidaminococcaceae bacterium]